MALAAAVPDAAVLGPQLECLMCRVNPGRGGLKPFFFKGIHHLPRIPLQLMILTYVAQALSLTALSELMDFGPVSPSYSGPGLSDLESELDDPGDFLNIRLPFTTVPQLERLSAGLKMTSGEGGDWSSHGATQAATALVAAFGSSSVPCRAASSGPSAPASASGYTPPPPATSNLGSVTYGSGSAAAAARAIGPTRTTLTGLFGKDSGGREPSSSSIGLFSRAGTQTGQLIVAVKGPGDSLGFAGMLPNSGKVAATAAACGGGGAAAGAARQPVWSASVRARTQVTAFVASIDSLHKLARTHPQVEPLLQQIAVQQETDLAVAEAMRSLRLIGAPPHAAKLSSAAVAANVADSAPAAALAAAASATTLTEQLTAHGGGGGGGITSEGESESCGTAVALATDLPSALSLGCTRQQQLCAVSEWYRRSSASMETMAPAGAGFSIIEDSINTAGTVCANPDAVFTGGDASFEMMESTTDDMEGVDEGFMVNGELE